MTKKLDDSLHAETFSLSGDYKTRNTAASGSGFIGICHRENYTVVGYRRVGSPDLAPGYAPAVTFFHCASIDHADIRTRVRLREPETHRLSTAHEIREDAFTCFVGNLIQ